MTFYQPWLAARGIGGSRQLAACADGRFIQVAGLLVVHQAPPTANGVHFLTLEDGDGLSNVIVRPAVYARCAPAIRAAPLLVVAGAAQRRDGAANLLAERVTALPQMEATDISAGVTGRRARTAP